MNEESPALKEKYPAEEETITAKEIELAESWNDLQEKVQIHCLLSYLDILYFTIFSDSL